MNEYSDVLVNIREPFSKNAVWIYPGEITEIKIFLNGWKTIATTKDLGLSSNSKEEINTMLLDLRQQILDILNNKTKRCISDSLILFKKYKTLENEINNLKVTIAKLLKFIEKLNGRK